MDVQTWHAPPPDSRRVRRDFSRMGWALLVLLLGPVAVQLFPAFLLGLGAPSALGAPEVSWALSSIAQYLVGFPAAALLLLDLPETRELAAPPLGPLRLLGALAIALAILSLSELLTIALVTLLQAGGLAGSNPLDAVLEAEPLPLVMVSVCVLAPLWEEYFFRRLLLRRLAPYGGRFAALASALAFSLTHANLYQMLYAFTLGLFFAVLTLKTGRLRYTILLHAAINFLGGGFLPDLLGEDASALLVPFAAAAVLAGAALLFLARRSLALGRDGPALSPGRRWALLLGSPGMLAFCAVALSIAALYLI